MTQLTCPLAALIPKARNAADLSSIDVMRVNFFLLESLAAAKARGSDLLPGQRTKYFTPLATRVLRSSKLIKKLYRANEIAKRKTTSIFLRSFLKRN